MTRILFVNDRAHEMETFLTTCAKVTIVATAYDGPEGVQMAQDLWGQYDLILMDVQMPGEYDGIEATKRIIATLPHAKIAMYSNATNVHDGVAAGAVAVINTSSDGFSMREKLGEIVAS